MLKDILYKILVNLHLVPARGFLGERPWWVSQRKSSSFLSLEKLKCDDQRAGSFSSLRYSDDFRKTFMRILPNSFELTFLFLLVLPFLDNIRPKFCFPVFLFAKYHKIFDVFALWKNSSSLYLWNSNHSLPTTHFEFSFFAYYWHWLWILRKL